MKRILTGLKPSGELTLGSYIGGIKQSIKYQDEYDSFMFVPDMHAITVPQDSKELSERIKKNVALYIACGIDPKKNTIYLQSDNLYHANLSWILECNTYFGEASRMTQFKDKSSKGENVSVGLFTYPILMAADILLYDADIVPTGIDQKQHVELTRDIAIRFNNKYKEIFTIPEPLIPEIGAKIMDLQEPTKKMSKSDGDTKGSILLLDNEQVVRKKIAAAVTDSIGKINYDVEKQPGISNLITIYSALTGKTIDSVVSEFEDANYGTFKNAVADVIVNELNRIQDKYNELINSNEIEKILEQGKIKTNEIAKKKYEEVRNLVGLHL